MRCRLLRGAVVERFPHGCRGGGGQAVESPQHVPQIRRRRLRQQHAHVLPESDPQRGAVLPVEVEVGAVPRRLRVEERPQPRLLGQCGVDVVRDHPVRQQPTQHRPGGGGIRRGRVRVCEGVRVPLRRRAEGARGPLSAVVTQPHQRVEDGRGVDGRPHAVPLELRVEERHVVLERVVAAEEGRRGGTAARLRLATQVRGEPASNLAKGRRARHDRVAEAVHRARLRRDGHARVDEHPSRRSHPRAAPPVRGAQLDDSVRGRVKPGRLRVEDEHEPLADPRGGRGEARAGRRRRQRRRRR
mmetsp:Transcript_42758/g.140479  ORF Transcript_42758/g.140479 Transcript_42758/m.140479 type:complete len:300 (+) Transcript_42758:759-1658(+)